MLPSLEEVIEIIKAGDKVRGRALLANIIQADLENEKAWLWLSGVSDSDGERRRCLNRVLEINPDNQAAKRGLAKLDQKQGGQPQPPSSLPPVEPQPAPSYSLGARLAARQQDPLSRDEQRSPREEQSPAEDPPPNEEQSLDEEPAPDDIPAPWLDPDPPTVEPPAKPAVESTDLSPLELPDDGETVPSEPETPILPEDDRFDETSLPKQMDDPQPFPGEDSETVPEAVTEVEDEIEDEISLEDKALDAYRQLGPKLPAFVRPAHARLAQYGETDRGKTVIELGLVGLLLSCAACVIFGLVFQPVIEQVPPTLAAIVGTETPTATFTPIPPTSTPTFTLTPTPTDTPTPSPTPTSTQVVFDTPTVTATPTRTPSPVPIARVVIVTLDGFQEYVDIQNRGDQPQDLAGWTLLSEQGGQTCVLAGTIQPGETLRVWARLADAFQGGYNCGFEQDIWNDTESDRAVLYNLDGVEVSRLE